MAPRMLAYSQEKDKMEKKSDPFGENKKPV